jgi:hypothetical protein
MKLSYGYSCYKTRGYIKTNGKKMRISSLSSPASITLGLAIMILPLLSLNTKAMTTTFALTIGPDYLRVIQPSVSTAFVNNQVVSMSLSTEGNIPQQPDGFINSNILTGFGWIELESGKVFAITITPAMPTRGSSLASTTSSPTSATTTVYPSSSNNPYRSSNTWQAHIMTLTGGQTYPHDYCIASGDQNPLPNVQISIIGNTMSAQVFRDQLPFAPQSFNTAVGFTLQQDYRCHSGLAMQISS